MATRYMLLIYCAIVCMGCEDSIRLDKQPIYRDFSGVYPHLAFYNSQGECGTGALVPWAEKLWAITYSPHFPNGSDDKLYEIDQHLNLKIREESIGGTPANRMIHLESEQLFIGPYAINKSGEVRAIPYEVMKGRHTGNARHLDDPANLVYYGTMEEGFYEVDVHTLQVKTLYVDNHEKGDPGGKGPQNAFLPGAHGKGLYSGQGVLVYSNNGEKGEQALKRFDIPSGGLCEWDGKIWKTVRRNQFVEVTGPGGIMGNEDKDDPIWATGWDHRSLLLGIREFDKGWSFYRLPVASHSYDGAHGWNTEWPRIRDVGTEQSPEYLMTMHGMFWHFPGQFQSDNSAGIRPRSAYLKVIGDFTRWRDQLVFGCDDSAQKEFLNKRSAKGNIVGPGQSNSNLWFTDMDKPDMLGPATASGAVWMEDEIESGQYSEPFLVAGWDHVALWMVNHSDETASLSVEVDDEGNGIWKQLKREEIAGQTSNLMVVEHGVEWIRLKAERALNASAIFVLKSVDNRSVQSSSIFEGLLKIDEQSLNGGLLYPTGNNRRTLGVSARDQAGNKIGFYELDSDMQLRPMRNDSIQVFIESKVKIPKDVVKVEKSSILVIDDQGRRWRLPKSHSKFDSYTNLAQGRICREVATERDLFHCHGTFYELPAENADGYAKIRPISTHSFKIHDYASYRGMLILSGVDPESRDNDHIVHSQDGKLALWAGVIDDLWSLGKPRGEGGPWQDTEVTSGEPSDPYLFGFYDQRSLVLSHDQNQIITFTLEMNHIGHGPWITYERFQVESGERYEFEFPAEVEARWVRIKASQDCKATALFTYE